MKPQNMHFFIHIDLPYWRPNSRPKINRHDFLKWNDFIKCNTSLYQMKAQNIHNLKSNILLFFLNYFFFKLWHMLFLRLNIMSYLNTGIYYLSFKIYCMFFQCDIELYTAACSRPWGSLWASSDCYDKGEHCKPFHCLSPLSIKTYYIYLNYLFENRIYRGRKRIKMTDQSVFVKFWCTLYLQH